MKKFATYGEALIRLAARDHYRISQASGYDAYVAGAESNVAIALAQWGYESVFITTVPDNGWGRNIIRTLKGQGVNTSLIQYSGDKIGIYFTEEGSGVKPSEVIYDRVGSSFASFIFDKKIQIPEVHWFHWTGITPAVSAQAETSLATILSRVRLSGARVSADLNYRSKLWQWGKQPTEVIPSLVEQSDILITTEESVEKMLGIAVEQAPEEITPAYYEELSHRLLEHYPKIEGVFIPVRRTFSSKDNKIALFGKLRSGESAQSSVIRISEMVDRIGSGDALAAGVINGMNKGWSLGDTLEFAVAASAYKHAIPGDYLTAGEEEILSVAQGGKAKINR